MKENYSFDDVLLVPQYSEISTREDISLSQKIPRFGILQLPIISSPMDTVTENEMASALNCLGGLGVIHRYNSILDQVNLVDRSTSSHVAAAIGVSGDYLERAHALINVNVSVLCVDIAHGHHKLMKNALKNIRHEFGWSIHIMAGNVATLKGFNDLADWGADSIRVGIGGGSICSTRLQTGHGIPTLQSIINCAQSDRDAILIADGGIRSGGDCVKALAAGADLIMLGSLLAGTDESPGKTFDISPGIKGKIYRGMASKEAQVEWRGVYSSDEGVSRTIPYKGPVKNILISLEKSIKSGLSYSGCRNISELQSCHKFIRQSPSSQVESNTHIDFLI